MLFNHLHIAFRTFRRNKLYSLINVGCLAIGIAVAMTILLYVLHEHSYDRWQANADRIFAVSVEMKVGSSSINSDRLSYPAAQLVRQADGNVESFIRAQAPYQPPVLGNAASPAETFNPEKQVLFADSNFFRFFSYHMVKGDPATALVRPYSVVITATAAKRYFGNDDPIGKTLLYNKSYPLEVTGVCADPPSNTSIDFECVVSGASMRTMKEMEGIMRSQIVQGGSFMTWIMLRDPAAAGKVEQTFDRLAAEAAANNDGEKDKYTLSALPAIHLGNNFGDSTHTRYLKIFPLVAGLILLLALINYMSLATARAMVRAKEVGVRKVMGAGRRTLAAQFYAESTVYALVSFAAGTGLFFLFRPAFLHLLQLRIDTGFLLSPVLLGSFAVLLAIVIAASGSYPSLVLSGFRPVAVLYGKLSRRRGSERVRKGFLIFQFTISMALIICSFIIEKQLYYIRHTDTGIDRENVVMIPFDKNLPHYSAYKREVEALPGVALAATAHYPMYKGYDAFFTTDPGKSMMMPIMSVDDHFAAILGLKWKQKPAADWVLYDGKHILLNETAVAKLGLEGDPVGQRVKMDQDFTVAGVLKDFNYQSLQGKVGPLCLFVGKDTASAWGTRVNGCLFVKINPHVNVPTLIAGLRSVYGRYDRMTPFTYQFLDDAFDNQYKAEDRLAGLFGIFTAITIVIACLGLFALATFAAQQRLKEIGIRKVLGASVGSIGLLLSRDFLRPVILSVLIASPLAWWAMHRWLEDFAYRTPISWWVFPLAGSGLLLVAQLTVLFRTVKAARTNPTVNLRNE